MSGREKELFEWFIFSLDNILPTLTINERMEIIEKIMNTIKSKYCIHCGSDNPRCQCENDE